MKWLDWRWSLLLLAVLLAWLQYKFWFGPGNSGEVMMLEGQVQHQQRDNDGLRQRNAALAAEVRDLKEGEAAIEERARSELGMIKPGEKFYRIVPDVPAPAPAPAPASSSAAAATMPAATPAEVP